ncbi:MAG TPA: glutamine--fructose-6-phosphate transaminase (isomerizing), partial [Clostridia bacterium]|nr:glutamine--fructose-6-phosphate transaminase (isomerizing) [Clostridia bacterium]
MCGIVGYVGPKSVVPILINGLKKLEYRGYDSAGIAVNCKDGLIIKKTKGRLSALEAIIGDNVPSGCCGIGHTRWATHGEPSDINSHPHTSNAGDFAVVHNGIIENYLKLKQWLIKEGNTFVSETDTEVVVHLINHFYKGDLLKAVIEAAERLEGSFALGVVSKHHPDTIIAVRKDSPLIVGLGKGEFFIASDIPAILEHTREVYLLDDREIAVITRDSVKTYDAYGHETKKEVFHVNWDVKAAEKGGYEHFMLKEIHEEPKVLADTIKSRVSKATQSIDLSEVKLDKEAIAKIKRIVIVACGTAYHAGMVGKYQIEKFARIPVVVDIASEFRYRQPILFPDDLFIVISQSGETADTIAAMKEAKAQGCKVLAIANVVGSTVAREADYVFYTWAG